MQTPHFRLSLKRAMVGVALISLSFAVLRFFEWARHSAELMAEQACCYSSLNSIAIALYGYEQTYGHLPPPFVGDPHTMIGHSWRYELRDWLPLTGVSPSSY